MLLNNDIIEITVVISINVLLYSWSLMKTITSLINYCKQKMDDFLNNFSSSSESVGLIKLSLPNRQIVTNCRRM